MKETIEANRELSHPLKIEARCSSLSSFCQVFFLMTWIEDKFEEESFTKDFFCNIGTVVHSVVQKWLGITENLYGKWKCIKCNKIIHEGFGPVICECKNLCEYEEYELSYNILTGHCDGLFLINKKFYIFELKTISTRGLTERIKERQPYYYHSAQSNMYTLMAQKIKLPYPLVGNVIVYLTRDNPFKFKAFVHEGIDLNTVKETIRDYKKAIKMMETGEFKKIVQHCKSYEESKNCPYKSICFQGNVDNILKNFWDLKNE